MTSRKRFQFRTFIACAATFALLAFSAYAGDAGRKGAGLKGQRGQRGEGQRGQRGAGGPRGQKGAGLKGPGAASLGALAPVAPPSNLPGSIQFVGSRGSRSHTGVFKSWRFTKIDVPDGNIEQGSVEIEIDMASVFEPSPKLNDHLKQAEMLDVRGFPKAKIVITTIGKDPSGAYNAKATLRLKGITFDVPATFRVVSRDPLRIEGEATLMRSDFNVYPPYEGGRAPDNSVKIAIKTLVPWKEFSSPPAPGAAPAAEAGAKSKVPQTSALIAQAEKYIQEAQQLWAQDDLDGAILKAKQAMTLYKRELDEDDPKIAEIQTMIDAANKKKTE